MKIKLTLVILLTSTLNLFAQDDLDDIFNDTKRDFSLRLGIDVIRTLYGTPNASIEVIIKEGLYMNAEFGVTPFGYKEKFVIIEKDVIFGTEITAGIGWYFPVSAVWSNLRFSLGVEYQKWNYSSRNIDVAGSHGVRETLSPFSGNADYTYSLENDYDFRFQRNINGYGVKFGADYDISDKWTLLFGFHGAFARQKMKFDIGKSSGVNWVSEEPTDWVSGFLAKSTMLVRYSLVLNYRL